MAITFEIEKYLENITSSYFRLILIVGDQGSGKTRMIKDLDTKLKWPRINLNLSLSEALMTYPIQKRPMIISHLFNEFFNAHAHGYLIDNTEVLFDKSLKINPISLLKHASRNRTIICTLNGQIRQSDVIEPPKPN